MKVLFAYVLLFISSAHLSVGASTHGTLPDVPKSMACTEDDADATPFLQIPSSGRESKAEPYAEAFAYDQNSVNFETAGAIPEDSSMVVATNNRDLLNQIFSKLQLQAGQKTIFFPNKTFYLQGGVEAKDIKSLKIQLDGTLKFLARNKEWPEQTSHPGKPKPCFHFEYVENVKFTSSNAGIVDGEGESWWGYIKYLIHSENRPRMFKFAHVSNILFKRWHLRQSAFWTFYASPAYCMEIRHSSIINKRSSDATTHSTWELSALNTDGFDVSGNNIWIHNCYVWTQDDCFTIKNDASNVLIENSTASGLGLTIGSEGSGQHVENITFRNIKMPSTYKGIYVKFRGISDDDIYKNGGAWIKNVTYENIDMERPAQWPIWIGPAQQNSGKKDPCHAGPCSLCWPMSPFARCDPSPGLFKDITLRNITINKPPKGMLGVLLADERIPAENIVFDSVRFTGINKGQQYKECKNVNGAATGSTWPVPTCMKDKTRAVQ